MRCDRARRLFGACWDDELTLAERECLEAHFASCESCRAEYDGLSRALELAGGLPRIEASADLVERVLARTRRASAAPDRVGEAAGRTAPDLPPREGLVPRWVPVAAAAAVVVVAALFFVARFPAGPSGRAGDQGIASREATAPGSVQPARQLLPERPVTLPERVASGSALASVPNGVFDHREDIEFILDQATLKRGTIPVGPVTARPPSAEGQQAVITF